MKKLKKLAVLFMSAIVMVSSVSFIGCGGVADSENDLNINYWRSGYGIEFLDKAIEGFKAKYPQYNVNLYESSTATSVMAGFGQGADHDPVDLYISGAINANLIEYADSLNDLLDEKADSSESKTIRQKYYPEVLDSFKSPDNNYYNLAFAGSMSGIVYNNTIIDGEKFSVPRTTKELEELCGELMADEENGVTPFIHFNEGYWNMFYPVLQAQYDGLDYYTNTFLTLGNQDLSSTQAQNTAKSILVKSDEDKPNDGRYQAMKALEGIISKQSIVEGSGTADFNSAQTKFINGYSAMMVNGGWLLNEVNKSEEVNVKFSMMKTPIISSITNKCSSKLKSDTELRALVTAIDAAVEAGTALADIPETGAGYDVERSDVEIVYNARRIMMSLFNTSVFTIPVYANAKKAAKDFIKYFYTDENIERFASITHMKMPLDLSTGEEVDTTGWVPFELEQIKYVQQMTPIYMYEYMTTTNKLFTLGTARPFPLTNSGYDFPYLFAKNDSSEGTYLSADDIWGAMMGVYESNFDRYLQTAGFKN